MGLSRKRKKELHKLQDQATKLWESQQVLVSEAAAVAREEGKQLGQYNREHVSPAVQANYDRYAAPYVERGVKTAQQVFNDKLVPAAGTVLGSALSVWDAAADARAKLATDRRISAADIEAIAKTTKKNGRQATRELTAQLAAVTPPRRGMGAGGVIAILFGLAAAVGVVYAAWQTLRADDELWVADDPLAKPEA